MKKYTKPTCEAMSLGLKGENIAASLVVSSDPADPTLPTLVKEERDWTDSSNFWGE